MSLFNYCGTSACAHTLLFVKVTVGHACLGTHVIPYVIYQRPTVTPKAVMGESESRLGFKA